MDLRAKLLADLDSVECEIRPTVTINSMNRLLAPLRLKIRSRTAADKPG